MSKNDLNRAIENIRNNDELDDYESAKQHMTELAAEEFVKQFNEASHKTRKFKSILKKQVYKP